MQVTYTENEGRIEVRYQLEYDERHRFYDMEDVEKAIWTMWHEERTLGLVPVPVQEQGEEAIIEWTKDACVIDIERLHEDVIKRHQEQEARMKNMPRILNVTHSSGVQLQGHVICDDLRHGQVLLDEPFSLQRGHTLYIRSMRCRGDTGIPMFEWSGELSEEGKKAAHEGLIKLYEAEERRQNDTPLRRLIDKLNDRSNTRSR